VYATIPQLIDTSTGASPFCDAFRNADTHPAPLSSDLGQRSMFTRAETQVTCSPRLFRDGLTYQRTGAESQSRTGLT